MKSKASYSSAQKLFESIRKLFAINFIEYMIMNRIVLFQKQQHNALGGIIRQTLN